VIRNLLDRRNGDVAQRRFDALLIDFYGTISAGDRLAVERACRRIVETFGLGMTAPEFAVQWGERFFAAIESCNHHAFRTLHECELASLQDTLRPLVGEMDPVPFVAEIEAYWAAPPIHEDAIEFLRQVDLPICCVSNADNAPLFSAIERHGLRFDHVITSEAVRCYKPDAEIFRRAVERLGVDPVRTIHVGDSLHSDIGGASRLGITATWVCRDERIHDIGTSEPHHTIKNLSELPAVLGG
jgi:putative hydrolase of the HAD superfamily